MNRFVAMVAATALIFGVAAAPAALADTVVKVVVNGLPITSYDIDQRTALNDLTGKPGGAKAATDDLINEAIQQTEANRFGLTIPDSQVNAGFATIAERVKLTPEQLVQALGSKGISAATLKTQIRAQIIWQELAQAHIGQKAKPKNDDIINGLQAKGDTEKLMISQYTLQQVIFVIPKGSSEDYVGQRRREAEQFRQRFNGCDKSVDLAKSLRDVVVKDIGRRDTTQLSGGQGDAIKKTKAGKLTDANQTAQGLEMIAVCQIQQVASSSAARAEVENKLMLAQSDTIGKDYLKELRDKAVIKYH